MPRSRSPAGMMCSWHGCGDEAVVHFVGCDQSGLLATTGVARCFSHADEGLEPEDFPALARFFEPRVIGSLTVSPLED